MGRSQKLTGGGLREQSLGWAECWGSGPGGQEHKANVTGLAVEVINDNKPQKKRL